MLTRRHGNTHFRCSFELVPNEGRMECWTEIVRIIRQWISKRVGYNEDCGKQWFFNGGDWNDGKHFIKTFKYNGSGEDRDPDYWAIAFEHPCDEHTGRRIWRTDIGLAKKDGVYVFSLHLQHCIRDGYIGVEPRSPMPSSPRLIRDIIDRSDWDCRIGDEKIHSSAIRLKVGKGEELRSLLTSNSRYFPVILVSKTSDNQMLLNPHLVARILAGAASVYYFEDSTLNEEISYCLPHHFNCKYGSVRIYFPRVDLDNSNDSKRHRFFTGRDFEKVGTEKLLEILARGICRRTTYTLRRQIFTIDDIHNAIRISRIKQLREDKNRQRDDELLMLLSEDNARLVQENKELTEEVKSHDEHIARLEKQIQTLRYSAHQVNSNYLKIKSEYDQQLEKVLCYDEVIKELPQNTLDVVQAMAGIYNNKLIFTERALKSASEHSFKDVNIIWRCLHHMATTLHDLFFLKNEQPVNIPKEFENISGFELAMTEGEMTKKNKKLLDLRLENYLGEQINIAPHVKYGNKKGKQFRIHFCPHTVSKKIVIGHCGEHLENFSSQKIR